ncbi:MAG TPA: hypothetical protein PLK67_20725, partial [Bryobacteraceae bacterium]|nr:hypothetical protein [Bryobacteraceae bacterium]
MAGWKIRIQDLVWLALFVVIAIAGPERHPRFVFALFLLAGFQVVEPKIASLATQRGSILANLLKLAVGYLIVHDSGDITSSYYWILLIPVVSAATTLGVGGTVLFTVLACAAYLLTLLHVDWTRYTLPEDQVAELILRLFFFTVIGYLTQRLAEANRLEARRAQAAAEQLAEANRNLQEAEAAVRRSERLAALGQLSGG